MRPSEVGQSIGAAYNACPTGGTECRSDETDVDLPQHEPAA